MESPLKLFLYRILLTVLKGQCCREGYISVFLVKILQIKIESETVESAQLILVEIWQLFFRKKGEKTCRYASAPLVAC